MRRLSPEEAELWARVASTIRPLSRQPVSRHPAQLQTIEGAGQAVPAPVRLQDPPAEVRPSPRRAVPITLKTLDGSWDKRLKSGAVDPERVIDLHGMSLDRAWRAIDRGIDEAIHQKERVVLLITGHHRPGEPPIQRGKIRAAIHDWLAASRHARHIAAVRGAHRRHGGGGSLYLILRRDTSR